MDQEQESHSLRTAALAGLLVLLADASASTIIEFPPLSRYESAPLHGLLLLAMLLPALYLLVYRSLRRQRVDAESASRLLAARLPVRRSTPAEPSSPRTDTRQHDAVLGGIHLREQSRCYRQLRDPAGECCGRRGLDHAWTRELARARRRGDTLGVIVLAVKNLPAACSDFDVGAMLYQITYLLNLSLRAEDSVFDLSGGRYLLLLPGMPAAALPDRTQEIRRVIAAAYPLPMTTAGGAAVCCGAALFPAMVNGGRSCNRQRAARSHRLVMAAASIDDLQCRNAHARHSMAVFAAELSSSYRHGTPDIGGGCISRARCPAPIACGRVACAVASVSSVGDAGIIHD